MTDGICPFATFVPGVTSQDPSYVDRVGFCDHTMGGYYTTLLTPNFYNGARTSSHFGISRKGEIAQYVNIFANAWAQGIVHNPITWPPYQEMNRGNPNQYLISTEHEDATITDFEWPAKMYEADLRVKRWCIEEVRRVKGVDVMRYGINSLAGHYMFDPITRLHCPGFWWRDIGRVRLYTDLVGGGSDMVTWAALENTGGTPKFKSYLLFAGPSGLSSWFIPDQATTVALQKAGFIKDIVWLDLNTLMAYNPSPAPDA